MTEALNTQSPMRQDQLNVIEALEIQVREEKQRPVKEKPDPETTAKETHLDPNQLRD